MIKKLLLLCVVVLSVIVIVACDKAPEYSDELREEVTTRVEVILDGILANLPEEVAELLDAAGIAENILDAAADARISEAAILEIIEFIDGLIEADFTENDPMTTMLQLVSDIDDLIVTNEQVATFLWYFTYYIVDTVDAVFDALGIPGANAYMELVDEVLAQGKNDFVLVLTAYFDLMLVSASADMDVVDMIAGIIYGDLVPTSAQFTSLVNTVLGELRDVLTIITPQVFNAATNYFLIFSANFNEDHEYVVEIVELAVEHFAAVRTSLLAVVNGFTPAMTNFLFAVLNSDDADPLQIVLLVARLADIATSARNGISLATIIELSGLDVTVAQLQAAIEYLAGLDLNINTVIDWSHPSLAFVQDVIAG